MLSGVAHAGGPSADEAFQSRVFGNPIGKDKAYACFTRVYDADHLAQHAEQNVRTMKLLVTGDPAGPFYRLGLGVTFRGARAHFETTGDCPSLKDDPEKKPGTVHCGVVCDGGSIDVSLKDTGSVLVSIPDGARVGAPGIGDGTESGAEPKRFGPDDKLFRLDPTDLAQCLPLADDDDRAAMRRR